MPDSFSPELLHRLRQHTEAVTYSKGTRILEEGTQNETIFLILRGIVRVEHSARAGVGLVQLGPGEMFGELATLEGLPTVASVIADEEAEVLALGKTRMKALLGADPALAARVFEVLAVILAGKLRRTTERLVHTSPPAMISVKPPPRPILTGWSDGDLPFELQDAVDTFEMDLLKVERRLKYRDFTKANAQASVDAACDALCALLDQPFPPGTAGGKYDPATWRAVVGDFVFRRTFPFFLLSATIQRCYRKPRGVAVDFETLERIDHDQAEGHGVVGAFLDRWFLSSAVCRSYRYSRRLMNTILFRALTRNQSGGPTRVTSLACGAGREVLDLFGRSGPYGPDILATCIDVDHAALSRSMTLARSGGCQEHFRYFQCHPVYLARGQERIALSPQEVIFASGLAESIDDDAVVDLLDWSYDQLAEGGQVILTNLDPPAAFVAFMEHILDWTIHPRDEDQLRTLFRRSRLDDRDLILRRDASGANVFAIKGQGHQVPDDPSGLWTKAPASPENRSS